MSKTEQPLSFPKNPDLQQFCNTFSEKIETRYSGHSHRGHTLTLIAKKTHPEKNLVPTAPVLQRGSPNHLKNSKMASPLSLRVVLFAAFSATFCAADYPSICPCVHKPICFCAPGTGLNSALTQQQISDAQAQATAEVQLLSLGRPPSLATGGEMLGS